MTAGIHQADQISRAEIDTLIAGTHHNPHSLLGGHPGPDGVTIRVLRPLAQSVAVVLPGGTRVAMTHVHQGVFSVTVPGSSVPDYRVAVTYQDLPETIADDPYRHLPTLGELDLYLIGEGRHEKLWTVLGAVVRPELGGTSFAVWAPNARGLRVIGDFNHWDGRAHPMRSLGGSGVWELFVPGVGTGTGYKFDICGPDGSWHRKADPMATWTEKPPATASVVTHSGYRWADASWLTRRAR
jgi:1,4-alpha-glucan branching enzyme